MTLALPLTLIYRMIGHNKVHITDPAPGPIPDLDLDIEFDLDVPTAHKAHRALDEGQFRLRSNLSV